MSTKPRDLGNNAKAAVNTAAEELNAAIQINSCIVDTSHTMSAQEIKVRAMSLHIKLLNAIRWLESIGAQTKP